MIHSPTLVLVTALGCALTLSSRASLPSELILEGDTYRTKGLQRNASGEFFQVEYFPFEHTATTAAKSVEFIRQPLSTDGLDQLIELHRKTLDVWTPRGVLTVIEKSQSQLVLKDVRFDGTLSGSPLFIIIIYELSGRTLLSGQFIFRPRHPFDTSEAFSKEFAAKEATWLHNLRKASRAVHESLSEEANRAGATTSGRLIHSKTNQASSTAGSGR